MYVVNIKEIYLDIIPQIYAIDMSSLNVEHFFPMKIVKQILNNSSNDQLVMFLIGVPFPLPKQSMMFCKNQLYI